MSDGRQQTEATPAKLHPRLRLSDRREVLEDFQRLLVDREKNSSEVLFQGDWLKPDEARRRFQRLFRLSRLRLIELTVLILLLLVLTVFPFLFLGVLGGIAG